MTKSVNLALQGGGSHGAFTWGVLDRLLEEEALQFEGITGACAGAVNAVVLVDSGTRLSCFISASPNRAAAEDGGIRPLKSTAARAQCNCCR